MKFREDIYYLVNYIFQGLIDLFFEGIWYLVRVDEKYRRIYVWCFILNDDILDEGVGFVYLNIVIEYILSFVKKVLRFFVIVVEFEVVVISNGEY